MNIITAQIISELKQPSVGSILAKYQPSEDAKAILQSSWAPVLAVEELTKRDLERDAIQLIAHGLPVMTAIRWGHSVLVGKENLSKEHHQVVESVANWLKSPSETLRIRCQQLSERVGLECAAGWLGYAVFCSGTGSIVPPELPVVLPPDNMVGHSINAAILLSMID